MYGLSSSYRHTEGCLYSTILFASFLTMATVMDFIRVDCFRRQQWKALNTISMLTHAKTKELI